jgi:hypothetical protein
MHSLLIPAALVVLNAGVFAYLAPNAVLAIRTRNTVQNLRNAGLL